MWARVLLVDESGRTFDRYGRRVFQEGEEQTVEKSSDEELISQPLGRKETDSEGISLSKLRSQHQEAVQEALEEEDDDDEVSESEIDQLNKVHRKVIEEVKAKNLKLAQKCRD